MLIYKYKYIRNLIRLVVKKERIDYLMERYVMTMIDTFIKVHQPIMDMLEHEKKI